MTPLQVVDAVLATVGEQEGIFHTRDNVKPFVHHAEQLLGMVRGLSEKTFSLPLSYGQPLYPLHAAAPDFIFPLRVSILKKQLFPTTLSRITDKDPDWAKNPGTPRWYFMVGCTHLGVYPISPSNTLSANITYVAQLPIPPDNGSYGNGPEWHEAYVHYAAAILLAKEQKYEPAQEELKAFLEVIGMRRDVRFAAESTKGDVANQPLHPSVEAQLG